MFEMNAQVAKGDVMNKNFSFTNEHRNELFWFFFRGEKRTNKSLIKESLLSLSLISYARTFPLLRELVRSPDL